MMEYKNSMPLYRPDETALPMDDHFSLSDIGELAPKDPNDTENIYPPKHQEFSPQSYGTSNKAYSNETGETIFHEPNNNSDVLGHFASEDFPGSADILNETPNDSSFCSIREPKHLKGEEGQENEAYDGDEETDQSYVYGESPFSKLPDFKGRDPFPVLERPGSGRYLKNPSLERMKSPKTLQRMYDPQTGLYITPLPISTKTEQPSSNSKVRKRIPRPPRKLYMNCAYFWSCLTCLLGAFFCAIPALRYTLTANASRKIGDFNSAHSYLKKVLILCIVALVAAAIGWTLVILFLTGHLPAG
ncbi:uncharacterized protein LOC112553198 isoform X1 [Pomacea canaliculata]|uniref:uncharacterized protein LOC112553198 isoform X1 n=1 Tax=Pomacea canaliculata TaxID=400727 RepID=UPI000D73B2B5|nr:uncharacterized protein LOC112553198 isoform X1 [Pomacea canaliculata]